MKIVGKPGTSGAAPFRGLAADGAPQAADDLRLNDSSQARDHGIDPNDVGIADPFATPGPWHMGCYPPGGIGGLDVGVAGRRRFRRPWTDAQGSGQAAACSLPERPRGVEGQRGEALPDEPVGRRVRMELVG